MAQRNPRKPRKPLPKHQKKAGNKKVEVEPDQGIRLNRFISNAGICSRREADKLIEAGEISINGKKVKELGVKVMKDDKVTHNGKPIKGEKKVYILLNKPKDFITTLKDTHGRRIITDLIKGYVQERVYPVGRLDRMTTGLILLTNDGDLAKKLSHPSSQVPKIYSVVLTKKLTKAHELDILEGLELEDGNFKPDKLAQLDESRLEWGIEIHSGKNRIIRRLFEHLGYEVDKLDRVTYAGLTKKNVPRGKWRNLTEKEIIRLKFLK